MNDTRAIRFSTVSKFLATVQLFRHKQPHHHQVSVVADILDFMFRVWVI